MNGQSEITQIKETLLRRSGALERSRQELHKIQEDIKLTNATVSDLTEAHNILQAALKLAQNRVSLGVNSIVTMALQSIPFEETYTFKAEFVSRRNTVECDLLFVTEDGNEMFPLDSCGYGAADIASFALRIAFWKLAGDLRPVMIMDEPVSQLDEARQPYFIEMMRKLSEELDLQFIISSHEGTYIEGANNTLNVRKFNKESRFEETNEVKA